MARWITVLDAYDLIWENRKGRFHANADGLSRRPHRKCVRAGCPDCTNEGLKVSSLERDEKSRSCVCPIMATLEDHDIQISENSFSELSENDDLVPNWLDVWSNEQVSTWQNSDLNISKILNLKSLFVHKPPKDHVAGLSYEYKTLWKLGMEYYISDWNWILGKIN